jgi:hypothetical protein
MAVKVVHVSDVSDRQGGEQELGRLVVLEHPDIGEPATLEVFPDELESLQAGEHFVRLQWTPPGARQPQTLTVPQAQFDALAQDGDMKALLVRAITAAHERAGTGRATTRPRRGASGRGKVNYASLEHAGEPHRGRITEAEKELVRGNLDTINRRLRDQGLREIDASDPTMRERYGL